MAKYKAVATAKTMAKKQLAHLGKGPPTWIAKPAVRLPRMLEERVATAVWRACAGNFKRLKLDAEQAHFAAFLLNEMLRAHPSVHLQMLHPWNGQHGANPAEAARSFVQSFAARHRIPGVEFDKAYYK